MDIYQILHSTSYQKLLLQATITYGIDLQWFNAWQFLMHKNGGAFRCKSWTCGKRGVTAIATPLIGPYYPVKWRCNTYTGTIFEPSLTADFNIFIRILREMKIQFSVSGPIWNQFIGVQIFTQLYNRAPGDSTVTSSTLFVSTSNSNSWFLDIKTQFDRIPRRGKASGMRWN